VYVAPPLGPGQTLLIRQLRDHAQQQQVSAYTFICRSAYGFTCRSV
jgi:hypothetical protein